MCVWCSLPLESWSQGEHTVLQILDGLGASRSAHQCFGAPPGGSLHAEAPDNGIAQAQAASVIRAVCSWQR